MKQLILILSLLLPLTTKAQVQTYETQIRMQYQMLSKYYNLMYRDAFDPFVRQKDCELVGTAQDPRVPAKQYRCGEIPVGAVQDEFLKQLVSFRVPYTSINSGSKHFCMKPDVVEINTNRRQTAGTVRLGSLDIKAVDDVAVSNRLGSTTFLKFNPQGDRMVSNFCVGIPGLSVKSNRAHFPGHVHKEIPILPDVCVHFDIFVKLGEGSYDAGKICGQFETTFDAGGVPKIKLLSLDAPQLVGLQHKGLNVEVKNVNTSGIFWEIFGGLIGLEDQVASAVQKEIREKIEDQVAVTQRQIKDGTWFRKYMNFKEAQTAVSRMSTRMQNYINSLTQGEKPEDRLLQISCGIISKRSGLPEALQKQFFQLCAHKAKINVVWLAPDTASAQQGCYANYFNPRELYTGLPSDPNRQLKWWAKGCALSNKVTITAPAPVMGLTRCLLDAHNQGMDPKTHCQAEIISFVAALQAGQLNNLLATVVSNPNLAPSLDEFNAIHSGMLSSLQDSQRPMPSITYEQLLSYW